MSANVPADENTRADEQPANYDFQIDVSAIREAIEQAAEELEAEGEPLTVARLMGTAVRHGVDNHRYKTVARFTRQYLAQRAGTEVETEVTR
jgi:hypothetical protein